MFGFRDSESIDSLFELVLSILKSSCWELRIPRIGLDNYVSIAHTGSVKEGRLGGI